MSDYIIRGKLTVEELADALKKAFPTRNIRVEGQSKGGEGDAIDISPVSDQATAQLMKKLSEKENDVKAAEDTAKKALLTIQTLHKQQQDLYEEFALLRQRYDEQKAATVSILWNHCARYHPDLRQIPSMQDVNTFVENEERVGNLLVGDFLGEGQFAVVKNCSYEGRDHEFALKIIRKDRITSFTALMRVSNEIDNLRILKSPHIVTVEQVIHTQDTLYIVTEKGGKDLFEFFDEHPDGVPENWVREIISCVMKGVLYCHEQGVCHRDLKPENILITFDAEGACCKDLKLCDFGLSTKFKPKQLLTDFCGSPGFFCPEMIIHGSYFGDKADVWSVGCILLELVLGHERFCELWMTAYDYEVLHDKALFTQTIAETVGSLPDHLTFSEELNDFILRFVELRSSRRSNMKALASHGWLQGRLLEDIMAGANGVRTSKILADGTTFTPPTLSPSPSFYASTPVSQEAINAAYSNVSDRERKVLEEIISAHQQEDGEQLMHLPPITPATPNIGAAKKILRKGNELANSVSHLSFSDSGADSPLPHKGYIRSRLPSLIESQEDGDAARLSEENRAHSAPKDKLTVDKPSLYASNSDGTLRPGVGK